MSPTGQQDMRMIWFLHLLSMPWEIISRGYIPYHQQNQIFYHSAEGNNIYNKKKINQHKLLTTNYPDINRPLRERAWAGPWTSSTMHCRKQSPSIASQVFGKEIEIKHQVIWKWFRDMTVKCLVAYFISPLQEGLSIRFIIDHLKMDTHDHHLSLCPSSYQKGST